MSSTTLPRGQGLSRGRWLGGGIAMIVVVIMIALAINSFRGRATTTQAAATVPVTRSGIVATIAGSGSVAAERTLALPFQTSGSVTEVLVQEGDTVTAGQPLARLDDRDLQLEVSSAQANLASAQARLAQAQQGNATPEDMAAAQANVASAEAQLQKTRTGNVTRADIAGAEAQLRSAQAQLDALKNPSPDKISAAQLKVTQAQINLQKTRDNDSVTKTRAELDLQKAAAALTQSQAAYSTAIQNWQYVQDTGNDPLKPTVTDSKGAEQDNSLNGAQQQQYYQSFVQAEAALHSAEQAVQQAQVTFDNARQQEVIDIQQAEAQLADAQQQLAALMHPTASGLAQAQASVDQARANLQKVRQGGTEADIAASQANVDQAQANLQKLTAPATASDLSIQQASVAQAEQALKQAQLRLENATLKAPFAGLVTAVAIIPGSIAGSATPAITLIDRDPLRVELKLSENDVVKVQLDQPVTLTIDSLTGWKADGKVSYIAPAAETSNGVVTYAVRVSFPDEAASVKVGMTANLTS